MGTARSTAWVFLSLVCGLGAARAQGPSPEDQALNAMRRFTDIGASDQRRISEWVELQVSSFSDFAAFRDRFRKQYEHPDNSPQFKQHLATQTAGAASRVWDSANVEPKIAFSLAQVLLDLNRPETHDALIAGLRVKHAPARLLCVRGLSAQKRAIAADKVKLDATVQALLGAGLAETSPAVLGRIYEALAYADQVPAVFDAYVKLLDKRLELRRGAAVIEDGAELHALEFFRSRAVAGALTADQKSQLVSRLAVFVRVDAERYNTPDLNFDEIDRLERMLDAAEAVLAGLVGSEGAGGKIRDALSAGGYGGRRQVLREAYRWVGDRSANTPGTLNTAPWSVPLGAP